MTIWEQHPELITKLIELARQGFSCKEIAKALGYGITRNAVAGKIFRLKKKAML